MTPFKSIYTLFSWLHISFPESATEFTAVLPSATGNVITIFIMIAVFNHDIRNSIKQSQL